MSLIRKSFKRLHYPAHVIAQCVRGYLTYALSLRKLEEMIAERGVIVAAEGVSLARRSVPCRAVLPAGRLKTGGAAFAALQTLMRQNHLFEGQSPIQDPLCNSAIK